MQKKTIFIAISDKNTPKIEIIFNQINYFNQKQGGFLNIRPKNIKKTNNLIFL